MKTIEYLRKEFNSKLPEHENDKEKYYRDYSKFLEQKLISEPQKGREEIINKINNQINDFTKDLKESTSTFVKQNCEGAIFGLNRLLKEFTTEHSLPLVSEPNPVKEPSKGAKEIYQQYNDNPIQWMKENNCSTTKEITIKLMTLAQLNKPKNVTEEEITMYSENEYKIQFRDSESDKGISDFKIYGGELFDLFLNHINPSNG